MLAALKRSKRGPGAPAHDLVALFLKHFTHNERAIRFGGSPRLRRIVAGRTTAVIAETARVIGNGPSTDRRNVAAPAELAWCSPSRAIIDPNLCLADGFRL